MKRHPSWGLDAPRIVFILFLSGVALIFLGRYLFSLLDDNHPFWAWTLWIYFLISGISCFLNVFLMIASSYVGKKRLIQALVAEQQLRGDETILDAGCGSGLLLIELAKALPFGKAIGVDLWKRKDQSKSQQAIVEKNARIANVSDRLTIMTADIRNLPFPDNSFDLVTSSLVLHSLKPQRERELALYELSRVLRPGGKILLIDFRYNREYFLWLQQARFYHLRLSRRLLSLFPPIQIVQGNKS